MTDQSLQTLFVCVLCDRLTPSLPPCEAHTRHQSSHSALPSLFVLLYQYSDQSTQTEERSYSFLTPSLYVLCASTAIRVHTERLERSYSFIAPSLFVLYASTAIRVHTERLERSYEAKTTEPCMRCSDERNSEREEDEMNEDEMMNRGK